MPKLDLKWLITFFFLTILIMVPSIPEASVGQSVQLLINGQETTPDVAPQIINGKVMVPIRWVAEALGAKVHWSEETRTVEILIENWISQLEEALCQAEEELAMAPDVKGEIKRLGKAGDDCLLLENAWYMDYNYWLCNIYTGQKELVVPFVENARIEKIENNEIVFIAKGGSDNGDYDFPYLLRYNMEDKSLSREPMYLQQDVTFGTLGSWNLLLQEVYLQDGDVIFDLKVAPNQVLVGGFKKPLTVIDYHKDFISMRIYNVTTNRHDNQVLELNHPLIKKVEWRALSPDEPVQNSELLQMDFPYGAALENINFNQPSTEVKLYTAEEITYNVTTKTEDDNLSYIVKLNPPSKSSSW